MGENPLLPPDRKLYMVTVSDSVQCDKGWKRVIHTHSTNHTMMLTANGQKTLTKYPHTLFFFFYQIVSTRDTPRGYSHHPYIEKE